LIPSTTSRSQVVEYAEGCIWTIDFVDKNVSVIERIPKTYNGTNTCSYTSTNHNETDFNNTDAYDIAVYNLLKDLDFNNTGKVFVDLDAADIEIVITTISQVPYLWGPTLVKANVWQ
jgi:hypothetical protein